LLFHEALADPSHCVDRGGLAGLAAADEGALHRSAGEELLGHLDGGAQVGAPPFILESEPAEAVVPDDAVAGQVYDVGLKLHDALAKLLEAAEIPRVEGDVAGCSEHFEESFLLLLVLERAQLLVARGAEVLRGTGHEEDPQGAGSQLAAEGLERSVNPGEAPDAE